MTIQEQIRERAEQEYGCLPLMSMEEKQKESYAKLSYIEGAESMIPVMKDVSVKFYNWYSTLGVGEHEQILKLLEVNPDNYNDYDFYFYFIEHIYQPSETKP